MCTNSSFSTWLTASPKDLGQDYIVTSIQVVDMRWGVRDEATDDHSTTDLCLQEVKHVKGCP